jgi:ADP-ribosylation factor-like protein 3
MGLLGLLEGVRVRKRNVQAKFFGLDGAGKTSILRLLTETELSTVQKTHGFEITSLEVSTFHFDLWDIAGSPEDRPFWQNYLAPADSIVWVVDSSDRRRLQESNTAFHDLIGNLNEKNPRAAVIVALNPHDPKDQMTVEEVTEAFNLAAISPRIWFCTVCNVRHRRNAVHLLRWIRDDFRAKYGPT